MQSFPTMLAGSAHVWFSRLWPSFKNLSHAFVSHFIASKRQKKVSNPSPLHPSKGGRKSARLCGVLQPRKVERGTSIRQGGSHSHSSRIEGRKILIFIRRQ